MLKINQLKLRADEDQSLIRETLLHKLHLSASDLISFKILKKNIDARDKHLIFFTYSIAFEVKNERYVLNQKNSNVSIYHEKQLPPLTNGIKELKNPVIIVGFGPAGIFAAYNLIKNGYPVVVFERGKEVEKRNKDVKRFIEEGVLDENSNIQYGEGGAGTYSDGKLTARSKDIRVKKIYEQLVEFGADEEILYEAYPHLGSDNLKIIIPKIRRKIIELGGVIKFDETIKELIKDENDAIIAVKSDKGVYEASNVVLALGNSSRDSFINFYRQGLFMENKPFAIGFRIEHHQKLIDEALYHKFANHPNLHAASYRLAHQDNSGRGCYTFCMCPGGEVVAATSLKEHVCVNGMSDYNRDKENANSAILCQVSEKDYGDELFAGINFQDELERRAYKAGGNNYKAPVQRVTDFLNNKESEYLGKVKPSYPLGYTFTDFNKLFPKAICDCLKEGLLDFNHKIKGFSNDDAILTGVETRTSSPVRITRDNSTMQSVSIKGVYPIGEGSGYAGGIVSSAIDGLKCAEMIISTYAKPIEKTSK